MMNGPVTASTKSAHVVANVVINIEFDIDADVNFDVDIDINLNFDVEGDVQLMLLLFDALTLASPKVFWNKAKVKVALY